jgi:hypothetical protein
MKTSRSLALLFLAVCVAAFGAEEPVPIEQEPQHRLKFQNQYVRFFDVELPPGYQGLWHWHRHDGVFVNILPAETIAQDRGGEPSRRGWRAIGETYFIGYTAKPKAHRVSNSDRSVYRVTDTEILRGCGRHAQFQDSAGQTLILENDRVSITRMILHPGESTQLQPACAMLVAVSAGEVVMNSGEGESRLTLGRAGYLWQERATAQTLTNAGRTVFHGVDIRIK